MTTRYFDLLSSSEVFHSSVGKGFIGPLIRVCERKREEKVKVSFTLTITHSVFCLVPLLFYYF